ncbi:hypothetical protein [Rhodoplanes sp. Z2-YC6860]|uniref:hypothetical protein n=1 Tax=Rhodoplanes sp. Z2-YC6860 TaxID=674703 RepID=UPI0012ED01BB|nr:hypothetical protein [Rhodoplanes sp. Z2-YC6860]
MTSISDYRFASSTPRPRRIPADLLTVALWSLVGLLFCAAVAASTYTPDLPVIQAMALG